jgi:FixJ family two-component response regulator
LENYAVEKMTFLLVDDNADDRALVRRELENAFTGSSFQECSDAAGLGAALARGPFDACVTDYALRWSDGLAVLAAVKARWPDTAVIMFTGTGTQEVAVERMKAGLDDYLVKGPRHYARLPIAVRTAVDRLRTRRAAAELERRFRTLFDRVGIGVYRTDAYGTLLEANPALLRILGVRGLADARNSPHLGALLWDAGVPGSLDLLRDTGDVRTRLAGVQGRTYAVTEVVTREGGRLYVDGIVEERRDPPPA